MPSLAAQIANARTAMLMAGLGVAFIGLLSWGEVTAWNAAVNRIEQDTENLAVAFSQHADDSLELARSPLADLVHELETHDHEGGSQSNLGLLMDGMLAASTRLRGLYVLDSVGNWVGATVDLPAHTNYADREYFQYHAHSTSQDARLGAPVRSRSTGEWIIPVSRRYNNADGSFAGVVVATFESTYFSDYYQTAPIGEDGAVMLMDGDGSVLARSPFIEDVIGVKIVTDDLFGQGFKTADIGASRYVSPVDGVPRIGGFYRSWRSQLVVLVAVSEAEALAEWAAEARPRWVAGFIATFVTFFLALLLFRQNQKKRAADARLKHMEAEFRMMAENSSDVVERIDANGARLYVSPAARRIMGRDPAEMVGGQVFDRVHPDDRADVMNLTESLTEDTSLTVTFRSENGAGAEIWLETSLNALPRTADGAAAGAVAVTRDVTARKQMEVKLAEMATIDGLTGLANRRAFDDRLVQEFRRTRRDRSTLSVLMIDADRFKLFNDTYGHVAGDTCLRAISASIEHLAQRPADMAARYGGEEIVVLLPNTDSFGAMTLAQRMCAEIEALGIAHEKNLPWGKVTVSIGVATYSDLDGLDIDETELIQAADRALYGAKTGGRNRAELGRTEPLSMTGS